MIWGDNSVAKIVQCRLIGLVDAGYISLVPLGLYFFLWFYADSTIDLLLLVCLWGYSLSIFIPTAVRGMLRNYVVEVDSAAASGAVYFEQ